MNDKPAFVGTGLEYASPQCERCSSPHHPLCPLAVSEEAVIDFDHVSPLGPRASRQGIIEGLRLAQEATNPSTTDSVRGRSA